MLEDLDFIVGDRDALKGRAILFAENLAGTENPFNPRFPSLAVAIDPSELLALLSTIAPLPEPVRDSLLDKIRQSADIWSRTMFGQSMYQFVKEMLAKGLDQVNLPDEFKEQIREEMSGIPEEPTGLPFHGCFMPLVGFDPEVIEPYEATCDVARVKPVPSVTYAGLVLNGHAQHYLAEYLLQREQSAPKLDKTAEADGPGARDLPASEFLTLLNRKVSELLYAKESGGSMEKPIRELQKLTTGTIFIRDVLNLQKFVKDPHPGRIEILGLYLKRITLLAQEKYEDIPAVDRRLAELLKA
ncbi:MAG: hypothetical protein MUC63_08180 [Planctomycetes bacterium]|nr:hypothetical protein [Planctomycetota bacterium]